MKGSDKFLGAIVLGVAILVLATLAVITWQPEVIYVSAITPDGVVHNYLLAISNNDYALAYSYLSPKLPGRPRSVAEFRKGLSYYGERDNDGRDLSIISTKMFEDEAYVVVRETQFYQGGLFTSSQYSDDFSFTLSLDSGKWGITDVDNYRYFQYCWSRFDGCN